jgi:hypothetical protein
MKAARIHRWDVTYQEAVALQKELREGLILSEARLGPFRRSGDRPPTRFRPGRPSGLLLDLPAIGCAKSLLVGSHGDVGEKQGSWTELLYRTRRVGAAVRTWDRVRPVYVSQGHRITLERAVALVLGCCRGHRIPEPVRLAHLAVNRLRLERRCGNGP